MVNTDTALRSAATVLLVNVGARYMQCLTMFDVSGRTWFSSQGPSPVFMDSQQNGSRVKARLGDEVSPGNN